MRRASAIGALDACEALCEGSKAAGEMHQHFIALRRLIVRDVAYPTVPSTVRIGLMRGAVLCDRVFVTMNEHEIAIARRDDRLIASFEYDSVSGQVFLLKAAV